MKDFFKYFIGFLLPLVVGAMLLGAAVAVYRVAPDPPTSTPQLLQEVVGQETAEVGELVRFLAEGDIVKWDCLPKTSDCESYGEHGENFLVSFRHPGVYNIITAIYKDSKLVIETHQITVGEKSSPKQNINKRIAKRVEDAARKHKVSKQELVVLSENFRKVAHLIESGKYATSDEIFKATADLNSALSPNADLIGDIQLLILDEDQYLVVWYSIAEGLANASK